MATFSDDFTRADGAIGADYETPPENQISDQVDAIDFAIVSNGLTCADDPNANPHHLFGTARLLTAIPGDQQITLTVSNLDDCGFSGNIEIYAHMNGTDAACRVASWSTFDPPPASMYDYDSAGTSSADFSNFVDPASSLASTTEFRLVSKTSGEWQIWTNGVLTDSGTTPGVATGDYVGFGVRWNQSGGDSSPRIEAFEAETLTTFSSTADAITQRPSSVHGRLIGYGTKRYGVELLTSTGAVWGPTGSTVWGPTGGAVWGGSKVWLDVTDDVTGFSLNQRGSGSTLAERPNPGTFTLTLSNPNDTYSTWKTGAQPYAGPGAVMRVWINDPDEADDDIGWQPLILGVVEQLADSATEADAYRFVTITLVEPHSDLAKIDGYEQSPAGANEALVARIARLLTDAAYRFGMTAASIVRPTTGTLWTAPLQATDMAQNRLTELYLTADSTDSQFISAKTGQPMLVPMPTPGSTTRTSFYTATNGLGKAFPALGELVDTMAASDLGFSASPNYPVAVMPWSTVDTATDNDAVVNKVVLARVGGGQRTASTAAPRTGPSTFSRSDIILTSDGNTQTLANRLLDRGVVASQYATVEVDVAMDDAYGADNRLVDWLGQLDLYQKVDVLRGLYRHPTAAPKDLVGIVLGYSMAITPRAPGVPLDGGPVTWTAKVNLQIVAVNSYTP